MKRQLLVVLALSFLLASGSIKSQILMDENFNYPEGDSLGAHGWVSFSGGNTNVLSVATPGLTYSSYPLSGIGNSTRVRNFGQDAYKQFSPDPSGSIYAAFMVRVDSAQTGDYFFALLPDNSTSNYTGRIYVKDSLGTIRFGLAKATNPIVYSGSTFNYGITYLVIVKHTIIAGTQNDEVRLFVFSGAIPGTEPAPLIGPVTQIIGDAPNISRVALRQGTSTSSPTVMVDGIRVFKSWSNIVGIRPISTVAEQFSLSQNYPNPFNPNTNIRFSIPERGFVTLKIYDMLGKDVSNLVEGNYSTGTYEVNFEGKGLSSGIYIYRMNFISSNGKEFTDTKKLMLVK